MRILFISRLYPNKYDPRNGAVIHNQAKELLKSNIQVEVISPIPIVPKILKKRRKKWQEYYDLPKSRNYEGVKVWHPRFLDFPFKGFDPFKGNAIIRATKKVIHEIYSKNKFDVVHVHMGFPDNSVGAYIKEKYNVPLITTIRSTDMDISIHNKKIKQQMEVSLRKSDQIINPSPQLGKKLEKAFKLDSKHIGNGIYPFKRRKESKVTFKNGKFRNNNIMISISNLISSKGIQYNIAAMKRLVIKFPNLIYLIVGDGPYRNVLEEQVQDLKLDKQIIFIGNVAHEEAMKYLSISDIFSMPSYRETFGLVYLEAIYYKKPIILCEDNGVDGVVKHEESAVIIPEKKVEPLIYYIKKILEDQEFNKKIVENSFKIITKTYFWDKIGIDLINEYEKVFTTEKRSNLISDKARFTDV